MRLPRRLAIVGALALTAVWSSACAGPDGEAADATPQAADASTDVEAADAAVNAVTVIGLDYAFGGPRTLPPGPTSIAFENRGEVDHEMILVLLREGVTLDQVLEGVAAGADPGDFTEGGAAILIVGPGETAGSRVQVDLLPGRTYALVCNLQDEPDAPPHAALGMVAALEVSAG